MSQPYPPQYPQQPSGSSGQYPPAGRPAKKRKWPWIVGGLIVLGVIGSAIGGNSEPAPPAPAPAGAPAQPAPAPAPEAPAAAPPAAPAAPVAPAGEDVIRYEVVGDGVDEVTTISYVADENFSQQQANGESLPWSTEITLPNGLFDYQALSLVAQSGSGDGGEITCRILRNGEVVVESTSSGAYAVVTCSGT